MKSIVRARFKQAGLLFALPFIPVLWLIGYFFGDQYYDHSLKMWLKCWWYSWAACNMDANTQAEGRPPRKNDNG